MKRIVLVCVTVQKECERLIVAGRDLARAESMPLHVLHVLGPDDKPLGSPDEKETLNHLYALAREAGAEMTLQSAKDVRRAIADYAKEHFAACVIVGSDRQGGWQMADALQSMLDKNLRVIRA